MANSFEPLSAINRERVLASLTCYLETRLKLRVNRTKSAVDRPWKRSFLGYSVDGRKRNIRLKVGPKPLQRLRGNLKTVFRRGRGWRIYRTVEALAPKLRGWIGYFRHADLKGCLSSWTAGYGVTCVSSCGGSGSVRLRGQRC